MTAGAGFIGPHYDLSDQVSVYHSRDIPAGLHAAQRTALCWLLRGPMRTYTLGVLAGFKSNQKKSMDAHIATMTHRVGNLCEAEDGTVGLVSRGGYSVIGE